MTIHEWVINYLENELLLFPVPAMQIALLFKGDPINEAMESRWSDQIEGYPQALLKALRHHLNTITLQWLRVNMPQHFMIMYLEEIAAAEPANPNPITPER